MAKQYKKPRRPPPGSIPGTIATDPTQARTEMRLIAYSPTEFEEKMLDGPEALKKYLADPRWTVIWLDIDGLGDAEVLESIGTAAGLHKLSLADAANPYQRPKVEDFGKYLFVVLLAPFFGTDGALETEQISLCLGERLVLSFQERAKPGDCFGPVRDRLRKAIGLLRHRGPDLLVSALTDATIDAYFPILENLGEEVEKIEDRSMTELDTATMRELHRVRRDFLSIRRAAWPLREAMGTLYREQTPLIAEGTRPYLRDCYDHAVQIIDLVEAGRELGASLMEMHLSMASLRMNEIMKVLTIITTIFIPLSFIAGIYGMNFDTSHPLNMPELRSPYGYMVVLAIMGVIAGVMMWWFWKKGWIWRKPPQRG